MSLVINHNQMAAVAARNLGVIYLRLSESAERLSSGLRINSAKDDAAGLAVRELMRADIAALYQGMRNATDAVGLVQTADAALSVIDEKLTRMRELAEQAATGTYTTTQREIMNSEYQAMADEIDRIAASTDFNGLTLLNGNLTNMTGGRGLKVHFGTGNNPEEDYYFIRIPDVRATTVTGLGVGGDGTNDIWSQGGCCGVGGQPSLTSPIAGISGKTFAFAYNLEADADFEPNGTGSGGLWSHFSNLAGIYRFDSGTSLEQVVAAVNLGTQSRIKVDFTSDICASSWGLGSGAVNIALGNEVYQFYESAAVSAYDSTKDVFKLLDTHVLAGSALVEAINQSSLAFWAMKQGEDVYVFLKEGGNFDHLTGADAGLGASGIAAASAYVSWQNMETYVTDSAGTNFGNGGEYWGRLTTSLTAPGNWIVSLEGRDIGNRKDLALADVESGGSYIDLAGQGFDAGVKTLTGFTVADFTEIQDAADAARPGAEIRTQSAAQEALDAILAAISRKDSVRGDLGAVHARLENTVTALTLQADLLLDAESKISDLDVAREITEFTKQNILAQAATAILAQANTQHALVLTLIA